MRSPGLRPDGRQREAVREHVVQKARARREAVSEVRRLHRRRPTGEDQRPRATRVEAVQIDEDVRRALTHNGPRLVVGAIL